ncbi:MAG: methyltransferase domain-containing protein [Candidatus Eisenbacteria bacterium]
MADIRALLAVQKPTGTVEPELPAGTPLRPALLDVRDEPAFAAGHVAGSGHVPAEFLKSRRTELPPRDHPVLVLADAAAAARTSAETLRDLGYASVAWLDAPLADLGETARQTGAAARLWRSNAFLSDIAADIPRGRAADLAAGSGRDAAFLAMNGFDVEACDESPEALEMARSLARRCGVSVETRIANLEARSFTLPAAHYSLVTCFRFLHRQLFPVMVRALAPGGHLVYETYRLGQERYGRPRRAKFLLAPGELKREFEALGVEVLRHEEPEPPGGPVTARLWGRKPD